MEREQYPQLAKEDGTSFLWYVSVKKGDYLYREPVFRRKEEHDHGKMNNTSPNWWLLTDTQAQMRSAWQDDPQNKRDLFRTSREDLDKEEAEGRRYKWIPYGERYAAPVNSWSYTFETYNRLDHYTKWGSDDWSVDGRTFCKMYCNGIHVWSLQDGGGEVTTLMARAVAMSRELEGHYGLELNDLDKIIGRKVWYHDQEGVIVRHMLPEDRIVIRSEKPDGTGFNLKERTKNMDKASTDDWPDDDWHGQTEVHTGLFDSNIYWFRDS